MHNSGQNKESHIITLAVQSCGKKKYRLGIPAFVSQNYFQPRGRPVMVVLDDKKIEIKTTCGPPRGMENEKKYKKGYDLYHRDIHDWIVRNEYHLYQRGRPTKLTFHWEDPNLIYVK